MTNYLDEAKSVYAEADCLCSPEQIEAALDRMAVDITRELATQNPLVLCVMVGAAIPAGQLLPKLDFPLEVDYIHATRYGRETTGGELQWIVKPSHPLKGRVVLLIDDVLDEGLTLLALIEACIEAGAKAVLSAVLVEKLRSRPVDIKADFTGLELADRYLFGYGMDYKGYLRNAAGIYAVKGT